jgi:hypothetical protein
MRPRGLQAGSEHACPSELDIGGTLKLPDTRGVGGLLVRGKADAPAISDHWRKLGSPIAKATVLAFETSHFYFYFFFSILNSLNWGDRM